MKMSRMLLLFLVMIFSSGILFAGQADIIPGAVVVKFRQAFSDAKIQDSRIPGTEHIFAKASVMSIKKAFPDAEASMNNGDVDLSKIYLVHFSNEQDPYQVAAEFSELPDVEYAEPVYKYRMLETPDDPLYVQQTHLSVIKAAEAWSVVKGNKSTLIGIVDSGVDWRHDDLRDNIWQNLGEDADGDGHTIEFIDGEWVLDPGDLNGVDDDNQDGDPSTFIDDLIGWDFVGETFDDIQADNDPAPYSGHWHGTHVAGLAAAVTNNQTGGAGSGYNCSIMISKHGNEVEGETGLGHVYSGIKYMADMGADIINCSFGGFLYSQFGADIVSYAYSKGALVVAAAGNNDGQNDENKIWTLPETPWDSYPASYPFVLSVANLRNDDNFYSGAFWGAHVDICAPGINALSTIKNNQYARATGTSMSSPVTAGVAALLRTQHPEWNPDQLTMQLKNTADDISNIGNNQAYIDAGGIGTGRLNALKAVSPEYQNRPKIGFEKIVIQETGDGNGNGIPDPGETINVVVGIVNTWADVQNLQGVLSTTDPTIEVVQNTTSYPYLLGFSAIGFNFADNSSQPFQVRIAEDALPHPSSLTMTVSTSNGYSETITIPFSVQNNILLVDDDNGVSNEIYYQDVLTDQGIGYTYWNYTRQGTPSAAMLGHKTILWVTEVELPTLDTADRNWLVQAAANGNHLIITGPRISYDLGEAGISGNQYRYTNGRSYDFHLEHLHAELQSAETTHDQIFGIEGNPLTDGLRLNLRQPGHGVATVLLPELLPTADAEAIFSYSNGMAAAIHYSGADYKLFYLAFGGLETLDSKETRLNLLQGMLSAFSGLRLDYKDLPNTENHTLPYLFSVEIESDYGLVASKLFWKRAGDTDYKKIQLETVDSRLYTAEIPAQPLGTVIDYFTLIVDSVGYYSPIITKNFRIEADWELPLIQPLDTILYRMSNKQDLPIRFTAADNVGIDTLSAKVVFWYGGLAADSISMVPTAGVFETTLSGPFPLGDTLYFQQKIRDTSSQKNQGTSNVQKVVFGFDDFESGLGEWAADSASWGLDDFRSYSGDYALHESPGAGVFYPENGNISIWSKNGLDMTELSGATLSFQCLYAFTPNDYAIVEASSDAGENWTALGDTIQGNQVAFNETQMSLDTFCGIGNDSVLVRFRVISDATMAGPGLFIDDVRIIPYATNVGQTDRKIVPEKFVLHNNYPNPFNPETKITYDLPVDSHVRIEIYNSLGQHITVLMDGPQKAGAHTVQWRALDEKKTAVPSGVYFYRITAGDFTAINKMILLK